MNEIVNEPLTKKQKKAIKALAATAALEVEDEEQDIEPSPFGEEAEEASPFDEDLEAEESPFGEEEEEATEEIVPEDGPQEIVLVKEKKAKAKKAKAIVEEAEMLAAAVDASESFDGTSLSLFLRILLSDPELGLRFTVEKLLPNWSHLPLPIPIYRALYELKFNQPTPIQERALSVEIGAMPFVHPEEADAEEEWGGILEGPTAPVVEAAPSKNKQRPKKVAVVELLVEEGPKRNTADRDLVGVAQTGSGKTLAYGLPILSFIISSPAPATITSETADYTRLAALILAPTRELALQVRAALSEVAIRTNPVLEDSLQDPNVNAPRKRVRGRHVSVVALTGGMSVEKQKRQLSRGADILVATPGRLWDLIREVSLVHWAPQITANS